MGANRIATLSKGYMKLLLTQIYFFFSSSFIEI